MNRRRTPPILVARRRQPKRQAALRLRYCATCANRIEEAPVARRGFFYCSFACAMAA
jgi:hypothetical protein